MISSNPGPYLFCDLTQTLAIIGVLGIAVYIIKGLVSWFRQRTYRREIPGPYWDSLPTSSSGLPDIGGIGIRNPSFQGVDVHIVGGSDQLLTVAPDGQDARPVVPGSYCIRYRFHEEHQVYQGDSFRVAAGSIVTITLESCARGNYGVRAVSGPL